MFIKRLEIYGFKSFPYKVSIPFSPGITAIVGPNGSGKSNILDAIRWVLGEQSPKKLRIKELSDLIFSGNSDRKIDFAEVKLFLNHEPPVWEAYKDFPEIVITRRFYRNGESDFFINQKSCRLKDIHFLFLDLGVNPQSYGIIEQGEVSKFIELSPKERKVFLEDLAGISRLKITEENTLKNLKKTEENLVRLNDIINEVKLQYEHLEKQAQEAKRYLSLKGKLQRLLIKKNFYLLEITQKERDTIKKKIEELSNQKQILEKETEKLENEEQKIYQEIFLSERKIKDLKAELQSKEKYYQEQKDTLENFIKQERELAYKLEKIKLKSENEKEKLENLKKEILSIENSLEKLKITYNKLIQDLEKIKSEKKEITELFNEKAKKFESFEREYLLINKDKERFKERLAILEKEFSRLKKEKELNENLLKELILNFEKYEKEKTIWKSLIGEKEKELEGLKEDREKLSKERENFREEFEKVSAEKQKVLSQIQSLKDRLKLIEKILPKDSKVSHKAILKALNLPALESLLNLDTEELSLLELVFKEALNAFVIEDLDLIKKFISEDFKENIFLIWGKPEIIKNLAIEKFESFSEEVLESYKKNPRFIYFKREKILLTPYGFIYFIRKEKRGMFSLKKEREILLQSIKISEEKLRAILKQENKLKSQIEEITKTLKDLDKKINTTSKELQNLINQREKIELSFIKFEERKKSLEEKIETLNKKIEEVKKEKETIFKEISALNTLIEKRKGEYEKIKKEKTALNLRIKEINKRIYYLEQEIVKVQTQQESLQKRRNSIKEEIGKIKNSLKQYEFNRETLLKEVEYIRERIREFNKNLKEIKLEISNLRNSLENLIREKEEKENIAKSLENKRKRSERKLKELDTEKHNLELKLLEKKLMLESIEKELKELGIEENSFFNKTTEFNLDELERGIAETKELLNQFQEVNLASIKEFELVSQRYKNLIKQKKDLELSINEFKKIIENLREISKEKILKTLDAVNKKLNEVFPLVFKNGKAELFLSGNDPLNSGLELKISIPYKGLRHINMLSGGEKALCALAILISFYLVKPGPFCILDEVDAFLDEKNSLEFVKLLELIKKTSQIILITHNPHIMKEVDTLIGVTMEEKGVSKIFVLKKENFFNEYISH